MKKIKMVMLTLFLGALIQINLSAKETETDENSSKASKTDGSIFPDSSSWILVKIIGVKEKKMHIAHKAFILIKKDEKKLSGYTSCNFIKGVVSIKDSSISFSEISPLKKDCDEATSNMERLFRETLAKSTSWKISDHKLFLYDKGNLILEFKAPSEKEK